VPTARADPASLAAKRAEVSVLQAQLDELDARAGQIIEAYNGARYQLGLVEGEIRVNGTRLRKARADHLLAQRRLSDRLVAIYREGQPSLARLLLSAGSLSEAMDGYAQMRRVEGADRGVVQDLQASRERMARARRALIAARRIAQVQVASAARQRAAIQAVLAQRRALLQRSQGQLAILEQVERARAAQMYRIAMARIQAEQQARSSSAGLLAAQPGGGGALAPSGLPVAGASLSAGATAPAGIAGAGRTDVVGFAMQLVGTPYQWGGASPSGFDCSGFVNYVYAHFGKSLPHYTGAQWNSGAQVSRDQLEPGDLVFFDGLGHDGIYIGGGQFIHSPHTGDSVKVSSLGEGWYGRRYVGAVRPN